MLIPKLLLPMEFIVTDCYERQNIMEKPTLEVCITRRTIEVTKNLGIKILKNQIFGTFVVAQTIAVIKNHEQHNKRAKETMGHPILSHNIVQ